MALDLNVSPYYDDAADAIANNYNRILFKPGYAVQARELTQLQSILQDQVGKFGNHVFKNGSVVAGCEFKLDTARDFIKVLDEDASGFLIQDIEDYVGAKVIGLTSSIQAEIIYAIGGSEADSPDLNTLYLRYLTGDGSTDAVHFSPGETIRVIESETGDQVTDTFVVDDTFEEGNYYYGRGSFVTLDNGIIFLDGKFLPFTKTTLELLKYNAYPYFRIGFEIVESIVTHETDLELLDPAQGTFNYAAPGADRYVTTASLVKYALDDTPSDDFSEYLTIVGGKLQNTVNEDRIYADLGRNLAKRTFDESGNYTVKAFPILIKEHLDTGSNGGLIAYNAEEPAAGGGRLATGEPELCGSSPLRAGAQGRRSQRRRLRQCRDHLPAHRDGALDRPRGGRGTDALGRGDGHGRLHGPRARTRHAWRRRPRRYLQPGLHAVSPGYGTSAV